MKKLFVIGAYPNSKKKEDVLKKEILSLKHLDYDIMIVSHYPVSEEIQLMVDFYLYDKNQKLTPQQKINGDMSSPYYWVSQQSFYLRVFNQRHSLPICQNMFNSFYFSEIQKYDFVFFLENDNIFTKEDSFKFNVLLDEMILNNKKCIFFKTPSHTQDSFDYRAGITNLYETQLFGITPQYFNEIFKLPTNEKEWFEYKMGFTLEESFYLKLNMFEDNFLIIPNYSYTLFEKSNINIFRVESFILEILYNESNPFSPILYCENNSNCDETKKISIKINDIIENNEVLPSHWFYKVLSLDGSELIMTVFDENGDIDFSKKIHLIKENLEQIKEKGVILFN
jgi:hypothetical protein